ncbi:uncharacterized protein LOC127725902 [Mytilus californianus]|uniref:uncharacterized protein LOC127725902 n=1 Tax=Mytilus californianus TaxID=6549 RepID=UPI0022476F6A|nr:uncharacterized protein LOC127725902 [Mytilus californianus]
MFKMNVHVLLCFVLILGTRDAAEFEEKCEIVNLPLLPLSLREQILENYVYETNIQADNAFCLIRCLKQRKCKSVNYNTDTSHCQLNSEDHKTQLASLTSAPDYTQYYTIDDLDESLLGRCSGHTCADDLMCEPNPYGLSDPYQCVVSSVCVPNDGCTNCMQSKFTLATFDYQPVGCFGAGGNPNPLPTLLSNLRTSIVWDNIQLTIDACANLAHNASYKYFGIEFWGECWVSASFNPSGFSLIPGQNCETKCPQGVADENKMFIYKIV